MAHWTKRFHADPIAPLLVSGNPPIVHWTTSVLRGLDPGPVRRLWSLPIPTTILAKQRRDGSWAYPGKTARGATDYTLLETYRQLGFLIEMFGLTRAHPAIAKAAAYVFSTQTRDGDLRGIYGRQYSPNYTAGLIELLVKAGYGRDRRVARAFDWFERIEQSDGGWAIPFRTQGRSLEAIQDPTPVRPDRAKPFSHVVTGVVLRAYAAHPARRTSATAKRAARLLASRLFARDVYPDRNRVADWTGFAFPFWYTDLVSSLDSISLINPALDTDPLRRAKQWFVDHQAGSGLFTGHLLKDRFHDLPLWHSFAVCRVFRRLG